MSELVDRTIAELRALHDQLAEVVAGLSPEQVTGPSGSSEWTIADVLSHLGSGAEIGWYAVAAAATGERVDAPDNQEVWDRWNGMDPADQASSFLASDEQSVTTFESFTPEQRDSATVDMGFLPDPVPLATAAGMRLNELALHSWDVRVGLDPSATLSDESAALLAQHFSETMTFLLGFVGKTDQGVGPARVGVDGYTIAIGDSIALEAGDADTTATFSGPLEAGVRLLAGRLTAEHTPADVSVSGDVSLDDLRKVFPGY